MRFHLMHIGNRTRPMGEDEEVYVFTPGTGKAAVAVPLDAVPKLLDLLGETFDGIPEQVCEHCGEPLLRPERTGG
jgi:hypothetical protein